MKTPAAAVETVKSPSIRTVDLPLEYFVESKKWTFTQADHLFDEGDLAVAKERALSGQGASIGGVDVEVIQAAQVLPSFALENPTLVLDALAITKKIAASLFPDSVIGWRRDECDTSRVVFEVRYHAPDEMDDETLYEKHHKLLARFHNEVPANVRMGVSLARIIN